MMRRIAETRSLLLATAATAVALASCSGNEIEGMGFPVAGNSGGAPGGQGGSASGGSPTSTTGGQDQATGGTVTSGGAANTGGASGGQIASGGKSEPGSGGAMPTGGQATTTGGSATGGTSDAGNDVCARWAADRADMDEGEWNGSVETCDPGDMTPVARANALRLVNLYRWLAALSPIETDPERDRMAQACALIQEATGNLSHSPMEGSSECWTEDGAEAAGSCNISTGPAVGSVDRYMIDNGNGSTIGHRRWILSNSIGPTGIGSTGNGSSCLWTLDGDGDENKPWVAWPPAGSLPFEAIQPPTSFGSSLDDTGWSIQSDSIDLGDAVVTVTSDGAELPVSVTVLDSGYGSRYAIRFNPDGWETEAGRTYSVSVTGAEEPIAYSVEILDCP